MYFDEEQIREIVRDEVRRALAPSEPMVTVQELAKHLNCSTATVYLLAKSGDIPSVRIGKSWRFRLSDVREALEPKPVDLWAPRSRKKKLTLP